MELSYLELKQREIVNTFDGKRLGHIVDMVFDDTAGYVLGFVVPGINKKLFKKAEDIFVPLSSVVKMGADVILVKLEPTSERPHLKNSSESEFYDYYVYPEKNEK